MLKFLQMSILSVKKFCGFRKYSDFCTRFSPKKHLKKRNINK